METDRVQNKLKAPNFKEHLTMLFKQLQNNILQF